jgi:hypothetical protein
VKALRCKPAPSDRVGRTFRLGFMLGSERAARRVRS